MISSVRRELGLKTNDGGKLINATGGGNSNSRDSSNNIIPSATGINQGVSKQLFHILDIVEDSSELTVTWPSVLGRSYTIHWSTDLQSWASDSVHPATGGSQQATLNKTAIDNADGTPENLTELFVRIGMQAP